MGLRVCHDISNASLYQIVERLDVANHIFANFKIAGYKAQDIVHAFGGEHDGTTYAGRHIAGRSLRFGQEHLALGVADVADGTALSAFTSFCSKIERVCLSILPSERSLEVNKLMLDMRSSLSDKCVIESKWGRLLEEKKFNIAEATAEFEALSEEEKRAKLEVVSCGCLVCCDARVVSDVGVHVVLHGTRTLGDH
jgi:hypothetical protein